MRKFTIVYPPTIDYEYMQQRPQRIMEQFARAGHSVYYINMNQKPGMSPVEVEPNLTVIYNHFDIHHLLQHHNNPVVLWMSWAKTENWIDLLHPDIAVYDCLDDFADWRAAEKIIVKKVDLITTTAESLYDKMRQEHPNVIMVKNGCEYQHFADVDSAPDALDLPRMLYNQSVVGYVGALGHWVDHQLILKMAAYYPVVLIGPEFGMPRITHPNVHRLGMRDYSKLPSYMKHFKALVIPFLINDITRATNPIKMYEYLATGKPVITTALPEAKLHPEVLTAADHSQFVNLVHASIHGDFDSAEEVQMRKQVAMNNSWQNRYNTAYQALCDVAVMKGLS